MDERTNDMDCTCGYCRHHVCYIVSNKDGLHCGDPRCEINKGEMKMDKMTKEEALEKIKELQKFVEDIDKPKFKVGDILKLGGTGARVMIVDENFAKKHNLKRDNPADDFGFYGIGMSSGDEHFQVAKGWKDMIKDGDYKFVKNIMDVE